MLGLGLGLELGLVPHNNRNVPKLRTKQKIVVGEMLQLFSLENPSGSFFGKIRSLNMLNVRLGLELERKCFTCVSSVFYCHSVASLTIEKDQSTLILRFECSES